MPEYTMPALRSQPIIIIAAWLLALPLLLPLALPLVLTATACAALAPAPSPSNNGDGILAQPPGGPPVSLVVSNSDLAVGDNRVSFGLVDRDYLPVRPDDLGDSGVTLRAVYYEPGADTGQVRHRAAAEYLPWTTAGLTGRGIYIAQIHFDQAGTATDDTPGIWELHATFDYAAAGESLTIGAAVSVARQHRAPAVGDLAPLSRTPTASDTADLRAISSSPQPDPALYRLSAAAAVRAGVPAVISFATPAFCVSATCGPQIDDLSRLAARYRGRANFVHIEVYRNPHLIASDQPARELVPAVDQWGLVSEPWTFVVDANGRIAARFEQYVPPSALEAALQAVLPP